MKFSFVMPSYKVRYMKFAVDSILQQSYEDFELIIINDASPEDIEGLVGSYHDPRIVYFKNDENIGGGDLVRNWNYCIRYAKGDYLILASDDDIYGSNFLLEINNLINQYGYVDLFRARVERIDSDGFVTDKDFIYPQYMSQVDFIHFWSKGFINCISNYVFRREALLEKGGFVNFPFAWFSDDASVIQLSEKGTVSSDNILFQFRTSEINISSQTDIHILKGKMKATDMFYYWISNYIMKSRFEKRVKEILSFRVRKYVVSILMPTMSSVGLQDVLSAICYLRHNSYLYKKEKLYIMLTIITNSRH